jgi:hypothetical protein
MTPCIPAPADRVEICVIDNANIVTTAKVRFIILLISEREFPHT